MQDIRYRQVEMGMKRWQTGEATRRDGDAVEAAPTRDDLLAFWTADEIVVVPHELDLGVVGIGTR